MKSHREQAGEVRGRFGSVPGGLSIVQQRDLAMISVLRSLRRQGLLIRRSWVRNPPGSYSQNRTFIPRNSPLALGNGSGNITLGALDPKSSSKPLTKANTCPQGTDEHRKGLVKPIGLAISATQRFAGECWEWA